MANESKKFALLCCCLMTMQALRLVISTAGFCAVRFHIDCELFGIFISRLVNAVLMSQLFGNWLGDLIVFGACGQWKLIAAMFANWFEFICFCSALFCIMHTEVGHLTGFYWSMVMAYFWWKVGEAPATSIGAEEVDWYFAGFTLSGVWAAFLKGLVMMCVNNASVADDAVEVDGCRSVKTTVDYRGAKWLFVTTIVLVFLMCTAWSAIAICVEEWDAEKVKAALQTGSEANPGKVIAALKEVGRVAWRPMGGAGVRWRVTRVGGGDAGATQVLDWGRTKDVWLADFRHATGTVGKPNVEGNNITIEVTDVKNVGTGKWDGRGTKPVGENVVPTALEEALQRMDANVKEVDVNTVLKGVWKKAPNWDDLVEQTQSVIGEGEGEGKTVGKVIEERMLNALKWDNLKETKGAETVTKVTVELKKWEGEDSGTKRKAHIVITITAPTVGVMSEGWKKWTTTGAVGASFGGVLAVPGAALGAGIGWWTSAYAVALGFMVGDAAKRHWVVVFAGFMGLSVVIGMASVAAHKAEKKIDPTKEWGNGKTVAIMGLLASSVAILWGLWRVSAKVVREASAGGEAAGFVKFCTCIFGVLGGLAGLASGGLGVMDVNWTEASGGQWWNVEKWEVEVRSANKTGEHDEWVNAQKWAGHPRDDPTTWAAMIGLGFGTLLGVIVGMIVGANKVSARNWWRVGMAGGSLVGGFGGLITGEIYNAAETWVEKNFMGVTNEVRIAFCGMVIVVLGLGTVYSIYPGMAPCSITQFEYFNIIDIWILILSSIGPIVIMYADLTEQDWRLGWTILANSEEKKTWIVFGLVLLVATNLCEIIVIGIMHFPGSTFAEKVTDSPVTACTLTIMMVSCQLVSTGIGFGCVAAGSFFNDGLLNVNSTLVLWTTECCGVVGEGYLTELKKYEPGKWPTQGMGKWNGFKWWRGRAFANAWKIWCCICTKNLRRDIMLCKQ